MSKTEPFDDTELPCSQSLDSAGFQMVRVPAARGPLNDTPDCELVRNTRAESHGRQPIKEKERKTAPLTFSRSDSSSSDSLDRQPQAGHAANRWNWYILPRSAVSTKHLPH
jgi:hypothetical protein